MYKEMNKDKIDYRHEKKKVDKRHASPDEIIYIFEKTLEGWKTIRIYNQIKFDNRETKITKRVVESVATGNSKIREFELSKERYNYYKELRERVYAYRKALKESKKQIVLDSSSNVPMDKDSLKMSEEDI